MQPEERPLTGFESCTVYMDRARRVLLQAGLQPGMRVADLGCGVGMVTTLLAELVGPTGQVVGVDFSGAQIAQARELLPPGFSNVSFIEASARGAADMGVI